MILAMTGPPGLGPTGPIGLDPLSLILKASGPVSVIVWVLVAAAGASWMVIVIKSRQLRRWGKAERELSHRLSLTRDPSQMAEIAHGLPNALGARMVLALLKVRNEPDLLEAVAEAAFVQIRQKASSLMTFLASVGAVAPFVGLLGTVYGILDAFLRIGREKSASLPVVAPAIGEALIVTAIGLFAAIPAVLGTNFLMRRIDNQTSLIRAAGRVWQQILRKGR